MKALDGSLFQRSVKRLSQAAAVKLGRYPCGRWVPVSGTQRSSQWRGALNKRNRSPSVTNLFAI